jgi:indoleacetamide hydrolase
MIPPPKIGEDSVVPIAGKTIALLTAVSRGTSPGSCASLASLVLPAGMTSGGLPVGLEFDALPGADRKLLALGLSLQKALGPIPPPTIG